VAARRLSRVAFVLFPTFYEQVKNMKLGGQRPKQTSQVRLSLSMVVEFMADMMDINVLKLDKECAFYKTSIALDSRFNLKGMLTHIRNLYKVFDHICASFHIRFSKNNRSDPASHLE
jgi:hypothetical protein